MQKVEKGLSGTRIIIMAITAGICVANIYYNQPILNDIAASFHTSAGDAGLISVFAQAGYGIGLLLITPLGDKLNRKTLIITLQVLLILSLAGMSLASNLSGVYMITLLIGMFSVAAQVILPMAAVLDKESRGKTVGIVFTGILVGILSARLFSGYIASWFGWRYVYGIAAIMVFATTILVKGFLPNVPAAFNGSYLSLIQSTFLQARRFALLRRTALLGALVFGTFCSFWTTLTFQLSSQPFNYNSERIGLYGLLAVGGALVAPFFGKLADKRSPARSQLFTSFIIIPGVLFVALFPQDWWAYIMAVLMIDIGVQATQVTNIASIYSLDDTAHSRINTVYMTTYFIGGAVGTLAGVLCWKIGGWHMVIGQLLLWSCLAFVVALSGIRKESLE